MRHGWVTRRRGTGLGALATSVAALLAGCGSTSGGRSAQALVTFHTRPDLTPPVVTVLRRTPAAAPGYVFFAPKQSALEKGPEIVDDSGQLVWFHPVPAQATDFRAQTYRGRPVLTWWQGPVAAPVRGSGIGHGVVMDQSYRVIAQVQSSFGAETADLHEFELTPSGTALITVYRIVPADLTSVGGPRSGKIVDGVVQEIDVATGRPLFTWHSLGHVALGESYAKPPPAAGKGSDEPFDYFHVNSAEQEPDGKLLISARNTHTVYEIDPKGGDVIWRLGGKRSSFRMGRATTFAWQHDARRQDDGTITIFDNGAAPAVEKQSRAIRLRLDLAEKTATLVHADVSPDGDLAGSQGSVQVLPGGNAFVGWGAVPRMTEFTPAGAVAFDATFPDGDDSYRAYRFEWRGTPPGRPAIAVGGDGDDVAVYASWNGATAVARWQLLAGANADRLQPVGSPKPRTGFETFLQLHSAGTFFAVRALDAAGHTLGTSAAVEQGGLAIG